MSRLIRLGLLLMITNIAFSVGDIDTFLAEFLGDFLKEAYDVKRVLLLSDSCLDIVARNNLCRALWNRNIHVQQISVGDRDFWRKPIWSIYASLQTDFFHRHRRSKVVIMCSIQFCPELQALKMSESFDLMQVIVLNPFPGMRDPRWPLKKIDLELTYEFVSGVKSYQLIGATDLLSLHPTRTVLDVWSPPSGFKRNLSLLHDLTKQRLLRGSNVSLACPWDTQVLLSPMYLTPELLEFLHGLEVFSPYTVNFVSKAPHLQFTWRAFIDAFNKEVWIANGVLFLTACLMLVLFDKHKQLKWRMTNSFTNACAVFTAHGVEPSYQRHLRGGQRFFIGLLLLVALTLSSSYVGIVMARLNAKQPSSFLDSLDKLKRRVAERTVIPCIMSGSTFDIILNGLDEEGEFLLGIRESLNKHPGMRSLDISRCLRLTANSETHVTIGMPEVLASSVAYVSKEDSRKLVLSDDHLTFNLGSAYVSMFSPYMDSFNFMIRSLREAGLIERWFRNLTAALHTKSDVWRLTSESKTWKPFGQQQLGVAFNLLGVGLAVASCVFTVEAVLRRYRCPPRMSEYRVQPRKRN